MSLLRRGKGLHAPDPVKLARRTHLMRGGIVAQATPTGAADLGPFLGPRYDQGQTGTCHAHSAVAAITCARNALGRGLPWVPSPLLLASNVYADVRSATTPASLPLAPLVDSGADLSDDATALATWGVGPIMALVAGRYSDVPDDAPGVPFPEPPDPKANPELTIAGENLIAGEYQIPVDDDASRLCALALDAKIPIWLGFFCDSAFEELGPNAIAQPPNQSDPRGGGHAVYLSAYRSGPDGYEFRVENSWGPRWAAGGAVWASSAWLRACWMLWPMAVQS